MKLSASATLLLVSAVYAHDARHHAGIAKRQTSSSSATTSTASSSSVVGQAPATTNAQAQSGTAVAALASITSGMPTGASLAPTATFTPGAQPPISGAPPLPSTFVFSASDWPTADITPPTDSDEVQEWLKELDGWDIPDIEPTVDATCAGSPTSAANAEANGWWTCGGYTRTTDIVSCPDKMTWGVSFDDGPSPYTQVLLEYLAQEKLNATFFVVGSRVVERPQVLLEEYMAGHEISVHTWAHPHLTTLTTEQIVAELGWSRKAIQTVLGVTPTTMRPPYGDIDDRVRAIALAMGMVPIIWTSSPASGPFDTNDWRVAGGLVTGEQQQTTFQGILGNATTIDSGFIVLEHDLFEITVDLARGYTIPAALAFQPPITMKSIGSCQGWPSTDLYLETTKNTTFPYPNSTTSTASDTGVSGVTGTRSNASSSASASANADQTSSTSYTAFPSVSLFVTVAMALVGAVAF